MAKAYSQDLRDRVIDAVKRGAADAAAGAQDATLQERRLSPEIPFNPCSRYNTFNGIVTSAFFTCQPHQTVVVPYEQNQ